MLENKFQRELIVELKKIFPGCMILKNDANYIQGIPDLTIFYRDKWATLECKRSEEECKRSKKRNLNQEYYISKMNNMSFSRFIYPENKEEVLNDLKRSFGA